MSCVIWVKPWTKCEKVSTAGSRVKTDASQGTEVYAVISPRESHPRRTAQLEDVGPLDLAQQRPCAPLIDAQHRLEGVPRVAADEQRVVDPVTDVGAIVAARRDRSELDITTPLAYSLVDMVIVETPVFTRRVVELLTEEAYRELQGALTNRPMLGAVISGSGGLRKVRWAPPGTGKRGGVRIP